MLRTFLLPAIIIFSLFFILIYSFKKTFIHVHTNYVDIVHFFVSFLSYCQLKHVLYESCITFTSHIHHTNKCTSGFCVHSRGLPEILCVAWSLWLCVQTNFGMYSFSFLQIAVVCVQAPYVISSDSFSFQEEKISK